MFFIAKKSSITAAKLARFLRSSKKIISLGFLLPVASRFALRASQQWKKNFFYISVTVYRNFPK